MPIIVATDLPADVQSSELVDILVNGANARAARVAPCLVSTDPAPTDDQLSEAILVLVGAVKRWAEAGSGALQAQNAGAFGQTFDTSHRTGFNLWPSEIEALQAICAAGTETSNSAFSIRPSGSGESHLAWCSLNFGALYCSCGVDIAGYPIFETG